MTDQATDRTALLATARDLEPNADFEHFGPGRFDGASDKPLTQAMDIIASHGFADDEYGSVDESLYVARIGRFLYSQDDQGFCDCADHDTEAEADRWAERITS